MVNLDKHEWDFSSGEKYAIKWLEKHGFEVTIVKRYISKDRLKVSKDGITVKFDLPLGDAKINYKGVMEQFDRYWTMYCELLMLQKLKEV